MQKWGNIAFLIRRLERVLINLKKDYDNFNKTIQYSTSDAS
jgi:hypothetical protein